MIVRIVNKSGCIFCEREVEHVPLQDERVLFENKWFTVSRREWSVLETKLELTIRLEPAFGDL